MLLSNHLIFYCHFLLLPSIFPGISVFPSDSALRIRLPTYWSSSSSNNPSNEYSGSISFRIDWFDLRAVQGFPSSSDGKESACNARDLGLIPGLGRSPGEGNSYPFQYPGLENSMDKGVWQLQPMVRKVRCYSAMFSLSFCQGTFKSLLQHHNSNASILWCSTLFMVQLSHVYMTTGKTIALTRQTFVGKVMSLLFNILPRFVIAFFPRSKCLLISWLQSPSPVILELAKRESATVSIVTPSICHEMMRCHDLSVLNVRL